MTREQFITEYMARSELPEDRRTPDGFQVGNVRRIAKPCDCGEDCCEGWQMDYAEASA